MKIEGVEGFDKETFLTAILEKTKKGDINWNNNFVGRAKKGSSSQITYILRNYESIPRLEIKFNNKSYHIENSEILTELAKYIVENNQELEKIAFQIEVLKLFEEVTKTK